MALAQAHALAPEGAAPAPAGASAGAGAAAEPLYGGFTRFELELECLANPWYLNHLAVQKYLDNPDFVAYLDYLQYFANPRYAKYLTHPGPTLRALQLLQQEQFRKEIIMPDTVGRMIEEGVRASAGDRHGRP